MGMLMNSKMYTRHIAWCPLVSHGEYADGTRRQTDGKNHYLHFLLDTASVANKQMHTILFISMETSKSECICGRIFSHRKFTWSTREAHQNAKSNI